ncbi:MAG TPA: hypothetical protein VGP19_05895 [Candidatus Acidoferrales bacterium]|jgi:hypothetical protein|nr:hypothetical protein [Candidatus Acidoferrales bacterium]
MKNMRSIILILVLASAVPVSAGNKKNQSDRGMLEKMDAMSCGAKQRGLSGVGSLWASAGITHVNSDEKLCPQYLLRTDEMEYEIRPTDSKHPTILPVGHEAEFKIKKNRMFLTAEDGEDRKTRSYEIVAMRPTNSDTDTQNSTSKLSDKP